MSLILPGLIVLLLIYAYIKKADVYSAFISGALEALPMLYKTLPSMCAMMAALSILRKSGAMEAFTGAVSPALQKAGMPGELVPLFLLRPFSGSARPRHSSRHFRYLRGGFLCGCSRKRHAWLNRDGILYRFCISGLSRCDKAQILHSRFPGRSHSRGCIRPCARPHGGCIIYQLCKGSL